ncbi:dihydroxyacetone kinase [Alloiococcus otitis]|uniref:DAK2 domain fusion protein YloV n=1 Tax=Alloiococcus otitis ATCC 51267 TaxID=883081 RepID=K9EAE9_9LACT|nr:DAK2 domain-containing protein [Alloiococcus otitis]EKU94214.1 DAK2 domain fusion protein YloV [Alloiococcus otitis ATCC 51267]SUU81152.1 dihydroxyacetone kinase [Alloiococcus otitis]
MNEIKAKDFKNMVNTGRKRLDDNAEYVNSLNVFPVPDGDTGTNMNLTFSTGTESVNESQSDQVGDLAKSLSKGLLMGARGNSGVILSQLFRGFSKAVEDKETLSVQDFADAFKAGVDSAYNAVMKPVEGTVLTVAREAAEAGLEAAQSQKDIIGLMEAVLEQGKASLKKTPDLLPVLKEVGVVDSGGQGLIYIYEGFLSALTGEEIVEDDNKADLDQLIKAEHQQSGVHDAVKSEDIQYGYCTEIMVRIGEGRTVDSEFDYDEFRSYLDGLGDSLLVVADDEIIKVHVHTETPGEVMNYGQKFGSLIKIKVDNMREQHSQLSGGSSAGQDGSAKAQEKKDLAVVAVAAGEGVADLFRSIGVDCVLTGGQTMNPSTQDLVKALDQVPADNYIILPNNKNIFMSAKQAVDVASANVKVVESRTIQQGLSAMLGYDPNQNLEANAEAMAEESSYVVSGEITSATRDTEINGVAIKKDDYMGIVDGDIVLAKSDLEDCLQATIQSMLEEDSEIITIIYGEGIDQDTAQATIDRLVEAFPDYEIESHQGDQPVYPYLISVE